MQHTIAVEKLGPGAQHMVRAVESCVHCGFCLPACPTYLVLGEEMDSPRGRIILMKSALEGSLTVEETLPYIDRCLGCLGCVTACPSGVQYGELMSAFKARSEVTRRRSFMGQVRRTLVHQTLPYAHLFRLAATAGRLARPLRGAVPSELRGMLDLLPGEIPAGRPLPALYRAEGTRRARVALLAGCVQQTLAPDINWATLRVLARNGIEVVIPQEQACCGALPMHTGETSQARALARANLQAFPQDVDAVITNAAGCGSGLHEYPLLFEGMPDEEAASLFATKAQDVTVFLAALGLIVQPALPSLLKVAYHDACHLAHAQKVTDPPRELLRSISNLTLLEIPEGEICCGSAGTYNMEQPEIASRLGERKAQSIVRTGAEVVAAGNIGCLVQLRNHLLAAGSAIKSYHTIELLDMAYADRAPKPGA